VAAAEDEGQSQSSKSRGRAVRSTNAASPVPSSSSSSSSPTLKKKLEAALKAEKQKALKVYKQKYEIYLKAKPLTGTPFDKLVAATQVANASQFTLPDSMDPCEQLPFSWKWADERQDDFDTNPRMCFSCGKTTRGVPSVACDFCPNVFHLDCLNPPLTEIPRERWMCPAHPEHLIDAKLVKSTSLSERLRLWTKYARQPVDPETVRLEFFRKARMGRLYQRSRHRVPRQRRLRVPPFVKSMYSQPQSKISEASLLDRPHDRASISLPDSSSRVSRDEQDDEFLLNVISMQESILRERGEGLLKQLENVQRGEGAGDSKRKVDGAKAPQANMDDVVMRPISPAVSDGTASNCSLDLSSSDEGESGLPDDVRDALNEYVSKRLRAGIPSLTHLSPAVRDLLALQRLHDLVHPSHKGHSTTFSVANQDGLQDVRARACLVPLQGRRRQPPAFMRYRT